jgi:uncharacterized RDD family membrane protein YckC
MNEKFCQVCGNKVMQTLRMCPSCGGKKFDSSQPDQGSSPRNTSTSQSLTGSVSSSASNATSKFLPADHFKRFIAYVIDFALVACISAIPIAFAYLISLPSRHEGISLLVSASFLVAYLAPFIYFTVMPASKHQATFGKKWMNLKLLTVQGEQLTKTQAFIRILVTMLFPILGLIAISISFGGMALNYKDELASSIGMAWVLALPFIVIGPYITVFFNPLNQTLYDMIAKTIVVKG